MKPHNIIILAIFAASLAIASENNPEWRERSWAHDGSFSWIREVPQSVIDKAPKWNPTQGELPLLPKEAYAKAVSSFKTLGLGEPKSRSLQLLVSGSRPPTYMIDIQGSNEYSVSFLVFLDGTVIAPTITKK